MKRKFIISFCLLTLLSIHSYAGDSQKQFDLHITVPDAFSYISANNYPGPIDRYLSGYERGFQEALENYKYKEEIAPDTVNGWGEFIRGHSDGFKNAESQLRKFEKQMTEKEIRDLIKSYIEQ
jgi:hypothetical protein